MTQTKFSQMNNWKFNSLEKCLSKSKKQILEKRLQIVNHKPCIKALVQLCYMMAFCFRFSITIIAHESLKNKNSNK